MYAQDSETKTQLLNMCEPFKTDRTSYNTCMEEIFGSIDKGISHIYHKYGVFTTRENVIEKMERNVNYLWEYMSKITPMNNIDYYQCLSCIFGGFYGDALGAYCEFMEASKNNEKFIFQGNPQFGDKPGQVTDDSEMAMSLAYAILDNVHMRRLNPVLLFYYFGAWYYSGPNDIGNATRVALQHFKFHDYDVNIDPEKNYYYKNAIENTKNENRDSLANGFLMRISPFIVWLYIRNKEQIQDAFDKNEFQKNLRKKKLLNLYKLAREEAQINSEITHPHPQTVVATGIYCVLAFGALLKLEADEILENLKILLSNSCFVNEKEEKDLKKIIDKELNSYENIDKNRMDAFNYFKDGPKNVFDKMGYYVHAFRLTLFYLYFFDNYKNLKNPIKTIMTEICTFGGDTDTNAAIVGIVIGPLIGFSNFGDKLKMIFEVVAPDRYMFPPCLMVVYIYKLIESNNKGIMENDANYLKMLLTFIFLDFKLDEPEKMLLNVQVKVKQKIERNNEVNRNLSKQNLPKRMKKNNCNEDKISEETE